MLNKKTEALQLFLVKLPPWLLTTITSLLILWLTLVPHPLGDDSPRLFPGADKVVHGIMFGWLVLMILLDYQRKSGWQSLSKLRIWTAVLISTLCGVAIEFAQLGMGLGRGFEVTDMIADATGAVVCGMIWQCFQFVWSEK